MGWFTQRRLNNLRDRMEEVEDQQHRLLHVQAVQLQRLEEVESAIKQLYLSLKKDTPLGSVTAPSITPVTNYRPTCKN